MEDPKLLNRPGGNGPLGSLKPLGMTGELGGPYEYLNSKTSISARRGLYLDDVNRVFAQFNVDAGDYMRAPVDPNPYAAGNIVKSEEPVGPAGYNQAGTLPLPGKAADLTDVQYLAMEANNANPVFRNDMAALTMIPQQRFLNKVTTEAMMPLHDDRMGDNLSRQEQTILKTGGDTPFTR